MLILQWSLCDAHTTKTAVLLLRYCIVILVYIVLGHTTNVHVWAVAVADAEISEAPVDRILFEPLIPLDTGNKFLKFALLVSFQS